MIMESSDKKLELMENNLSFLNIGLKRVIHGKWNDLTLHKKFASMDTLIKSKMIKGMRNAIGKEESLLMLCHTMYLFVVIIHLIQII